MSNSVLQRLGDKAKSAESALKSLPPNDSEMQSLKEKQGQIDSLTASNTPKPTPSEPERRGDVINPFARYGSRPGEKRIDTAEMTKPLVPVYDAGGDVSMEASKRLQAAGDAGLQGRLAEASPAPAAQAPASKEGNLDQFTKGVQDVKDYRADKAASKIKQPGYMPTLAGSAEPDVAAPAMPVMALNTSNAPVFKYDEGGDVDVNDGKHQLAVLQDGEKVLTPKEADQYRKEHEEKGAPADFGGRVLSNPSGAKPVLDTEIEKERAADTDHLPKGAALSTDNAPLTTPKGDISNPPAADVKPEQGREISTTTLRPYSEVVEEKAKQRAAEQGVTAPPISTEGAAPAEGTAPKEEKAKPTYGRILADQWLQRNGMPTGGAAAAPAAGPAASKEGPAAPAPQGGLKPIVAPTPTTPALTGKQAFEKHIQDYDTAYQTAMDKAAETNDPQYKEQAARIKEAKLAYEQAHPWGAKESAHPGVLGKIGHVAEMVAQRAPGLAPIVSTIPGSEGYRYYEAQGAREQAKEANAENVAENKADKAATGPDWKLNANVVGPNGRAVLENSKTGETKEAPEGYTAYDKPQHSSDQEQYINQWYKDHPEAAKSATNDDKAIEAYGTAKAAAGQENKAKGKIYYYDTANGRQGYTYTEAKSAGLNPEDGYSVSAQQAEKDRKSNDSYEGLKSQLSQYKDHISQAVGQLLPTDIDKMASVIEASESQDYVSKIVGGVLDDFYGKPLTGYNEKVMKGAKLTKSAYDSMSPAARQLVADYFTTLLAHFGNVKATLGQVPRNEKLITTEMNMIPKPYLTQEESEPAFTNYTAQVERNNAHNVRFGQQRNAPAAEQTQPNSNEHQRFIQSINLPGGGHPADAAKGPNGDTIIWSGKAGDPWVDLVTGKPVK
jgi:hypothetical protein